MSQPTADDPWERFLLRRTLYLILFLFAFMAGGTFLHGPSEGDSARVAAWSVLLGTWTLGFLICLGSLAISARHR
jgi:hypothetical protein